MKEIQNTRNLLTDISRGEKTSFAILFRHYYDKFLHFALLYVRGYNNAEDIVSDVFIKILDHSKQLAKVERVEAYLFRMVKNQCLDFLKKKSNRSFVMVDKFEDNYFDVQGDLRIEVEGNELQKIIDQCVAKFPPKRKAIYCFIKEDRLSYNEVADILDISPKTVSSHLELAIKSIRQVLEIYYENKELNVPIRSINRNRGIAN